MAITFTALGKINVGSGGQASLEFTSISSVYDDLIILLSARSARVDTDDTIRIDFNSYAGTNLSSIRIEGTGSSRSSSTDSSNISFRIGAANLTASTFGNTKIYLPNYTLSGNKQILIENVTENNSTTSWQSFNYGNWASSSAITSIKLVSANSANFAQHTTADLYGIKNT